MCVCVCEGGGGRGRGEGGGRVGGLHFQIYDVVQIKVEKNVSK